MPVTQRGIYHNLRESKYTVSNSEIVFYFSSELYLRKFLEGYKENREWFKKKYSEFHLNTDVLADITFYKRIEKRGYFARFMRAKITWNDLYAYALRKMNNNETLDWNKNV
jgi:hypothetical protein